MADLRCWLDRQNPSWEDPPQGARLSSRESELSNDVFDKLEALEQFDEKRRMDARYWTWPLLA
jgi:hypothetical protein